MPRQNAKKEYDPTNTAAVWANPGQLDNDKQPVLRGTLNVEGTDYKVSLWLNGFFTDDEELQADINAVMAELLELVDEAGSNSPIMRGKIELPEDGGKSGGRKQRGSRREAKPARAARTKPAKSGSEESDDENW